MYATPFTTHASHASHAPAIASTTADAERSKALIYALAGAEQTLAMLAPALTKAASEERVAIGRRNGIVRTETRLAARLARKLAEQLERAAAALPVEG